MPRVKGPLFSVSASGGFLGMMEFRTTGDKTVVTGAKHAPATRTPAQIAQTVRFKTAVDAWGTLSDAVKLTWKNKARYLDMSGYQLFISEYQTQNIVPPGLPVLP